MALAVHCALVGWIAVGYAPVTDEVGHLSAGVFEWQEGRFFLYRVNPPLVKLVASVPAAFGGANVDWRRVADGPLARPEFDVGRDFIRANKPNAVWYFAAGRLLCLPFTALGGWMCFLWARSLYGPQSGFIACLLWCTNPIVLGWSATFTPDVTAAALGSLAAYQFRNWLLSSSWKNSLSAGVTLGICELSKTTWIVLFAVWPLLWVSWKIWTGAPKETGSVRGQTIKLAGILIVAVYVLHVGYGFEGGFVRLGDYDFGSQTLTGSDVPGAIGNRFRGTPLGRCPVPLPFNYVRGIDLQKVDFEKGLDSYLLGVWSDRGWWYYYPIAMCLKLPLGVLLLLVVAVAGRVFTRTAIVSPGESVLFVPAIIVFVLICAQTGFGRYVRYMLPCLPAVFVVISSLWGPWSAPRITRFCLALLGWSIVSSLYYYPHCMAYFNEITGGPSGGHRFLLDANIDWGQDLLRLKKWIEDHPEAKPLYCAQAGAVDPKDLGIEYETPVKLLAVEYAGPADGPPHPGWYAISVHELFGRNDSYRYLHRYEPVAYVGYSIWIYHIPDHPDSR